MALGVALVAAATGWPGTAAEEEPRPFDAVQKLEYDVTYQSRSTIARHSGGLHVANRAHDLRLYFGDDRVDIVQRDTVEATWHLELHLESIRVGPRVHVARPVAPVASGSRVAYRHAVGTVGWTNAPAGVAVNLEVDSPEGDVSVEWTFGFRTELAVVGSSDGRGVGFYDLGRPVVQLCWAGSPRGRFRVSGTR